MKQPQKRGKNSLCLEVSTAAERASPKQIAEQKRKKNSLCVGERVRVHFKALAHGGTCIGDITEGAAKGVKVFAAGVIPGEDAVITIKENRGNFCEGELSELLSTAPARVTPPCPYFTQPLNGCGGCDLQHIEVKTQRQLKLALVQNTILHQGGASAKNGASDASDGLPPFHYRHRVTLHTDSNGKVGFYKKKSGELIEIERCLLVTDEINLVLPFVKEFVKKHPALISGVVLEFHEGEHFLLLKIVKGKVTAWDSWLTELKPHFHSIKLESDGVQLFQYKRRDNTIPFGHFSQVNEEANVRLVNLVCSEITGSVITELYAGAGNFSIPLAQMGKKVTAVELDPELTKYGTLLASQKNIAPGNLHFINSSVERYLKRASLAESVLLDPPRSGARVVAEVCDPTKQREIVYVSCNPATLARDIKIFTTNGFILQKIITLDMFSQTQHIETVALLSNK